ncbi:MAG TPA: hypothetical protein VGD87_03145 [Archangium sp.]
MTRQVALGAIIAFTLTVLALSVWEPKSETPPAPTPTPVPAAPGEVLVQPMMVKPATLRADVPHRQLLLRPGLVSPKLMPLAAAGVDAGTAP